MSTLIHSSPLEDCSDDCIFSGRPSEGNTNNYVKRTQSQRIKKQISRFISGGGQIYKAGPNENKIAEGVYYDKNSRRVRSSRGKQRLTFDNV